MLSLSKKKIYIYVDVKVGLHASSGHVSERVGIKNTDAPTTFQRRT